MARRVFFSFHYDNDINRSMVVRNSWVTQGKEAAGFIDKADFEQIKGVSRVLCKSLFSMSYHSVPCVSPYAHPSTVGCERAPSLVSCALTISGKAPAPVSTAA